MRWWKARIVAPLRAQLTQGVTPARLAAALALGFVVGVIPVLFVTTLLTAILAVALRLNQPAIQVANYAASPVQLALFIPLFQAGAAVFGAPPVAFTLTQLQAELSADAMGTVVRYLAANARAVGVWALAAPFAYGALFLAFRALLSRLPRGGGAAASGPGPAGSGA
jgi:uncharacterized protein (DUF2062 family)